MGQAVRSRQQATSGAALTKEYHRPMRTTWWLTKRTYFLFMVRELTCVFVGFYALFLLLLTTRLDDPAAFAAALDSRLLITLQIVALPMILYHAITWFNLTPTVMVVWLGETKVHPLLIAGANYLGWLVVSIAIVWIVLLYQ